jgi:hypothetical protein
MSTTRKRTGCRCVSDKEPVTIYPDSLGECAFVVPSNQGDIEIMAPVHSAKMRCTRCRRLTLELIPVFK